MATTITAAGSAAGSTTAKTASAGTSSGSVSGSSGLGSSNSTTAMNSLAGNLQDFLKLLMTQLQNQDPTSPMDTNQFTGQLVQYASVEQQINANSSLTTLIGLTQGNQMLQAGGMVGKKVEVQSDRLALQNGSAALTIKPTQSGTVQVSVLDDSGKVIRQDTVEASASGTKWNWDGRDSTGARRSDGSYKVAVTGSVNGTAAAVPFTVTGTATGVQRSGSSVNLQLGATTVDFGKVQQVGS